ncbi:MAG: histidine kinase [Rhodothermales bacterium]
MHKYRWIERGAIVAFWTTIALFAIAYRAFDPRYGEMGRLLPGEALHAALIYGIWAVMTPAIFWLVRRFGFEGGPVAAHIALHVLVAVCAAVFMNSLGHATFHSLVATGRSWSFSWTRALLNFRFMDELIMYVAIVGAGVAREYFFKYRERREEAGWLRAQLAEARLRALRMQINPHFLFNTLHSISTHLERDPRAVRRMIARLSELLRYSLEMNDVREVPLDQELHFIEGYLEIQTIRFPDSLQVSYEIAPETREALIPNLILQPLVENAIEHGVSTRSEGGLIEVRARRVGPRLVLQVADNGPGCADDDMDEYEGLGLRNTRERLEGIYGDDYAFVLRSNDPSGCIAEISLPFHTTSDLRTTAV